MQKLNCNNDLMMVAENIRKPKLQINQKEFIKTPHEKKVLKLEKGSNTHEESKSLFEKIFPLFMDKNSNLNITKFIAGDFFKFPTNNRE
jgi:hypothetical protein